MNREEKKAPAKTNKKSKRKPLPNSVRYPLIALKSTTIFLLKFITVIILVLTMTGCIVGTALTIYVMDYAKSETAVVDLETVVYNTPAQFYAKDKSQNYVETIALKRGTTQVRATLAQIPDYLENAIIATEDKHFKKHSGVDYIRTVQAFVYQVLRKAGLDFLPRFGASTITQQVIKNVNGDIFDRGVDKKIKEIIGAFNLERHYSKAQILEAYLNIISVGPQTNGVAAGAKHYFNKDISQLTLLECTSIAVISKSPVGYNPIDNPAENKKRRDYCLKSMLEQGYINKEEFDANYGKDIVLALGADKEDDTQKTATLNYYEDAVVNEVVTDLMNKYGYSKEYAETVLYTSGYKIYTNMDINAQKIVDDYFSKPENFYNKDQKNIDKLPDNAYMVIQNYDGQVVALAGNKGKKKASRIWNYPTQTQRPAGSTIKPLSIYTPAFENNLINWSMLMDDNPVLKIDDPKAKPVINAEGKEEKFRLYPNNYNNKYEGAFSIIEAIKVSKNTIPVKLCDIMTPQTCFDFVYNNLGLKTLRPSGTNNDVTYGSMSLGDGGVVLKDLTAAFQMFGNGGYYQETKFYSRVEDKDGNLILDGTTAKKRVISPQTAYIMNKALWAVVNEKPGSGRSAGMEKWEVIGKTGTSNLRKDLAFVGLTPYYVAGIRYGNQQNTEIVEVGKSQMVAWKEVMEKIHEGLNDAKFELSDEGVVKYEYCVDSGMLAHQGCTNKRVGYYKVGNIPPVCGLHNQDGSKNNIQLVTPNMLSDEISAISDGTIVTKPNTSSNPISNNTQVDNDFSTESYDYGQPPVVDDEEYDYGDPPVVDD